MVQLSVDSRSFQGHQRSSQGHLRSFYGGILEKNLEFPGFWAHRLIHLACSDITCLIFYSEEDSLLLAAQKVGQVGQKVV